MKRIKFKGREYFLIDGAISTRKQYEEGKCSFAHLKSNGDILRFGEKIGTKTDIKIVERNIQLKQKVGLFKLMHNFMEGKAGWPGMIPNPLLFAINRNLKNCNGKIRFTRYDQFTATRS